MFADYNERVNDFILAKVREYSSGNLWQYIAEKINDEEIVVWEEIILSALKISGDPSSICADNWKEYINNHVGNLSIALNRIIAETQKNGIDSSVAPKRFKPL